MNACVEKEREKKMEEGMKCGAEKAGRKYR